MIAILAALLLYPAPKEEWQELQEHEVRDGDKVYMVYEWSARPILCTVFANDRNGFRRFRSNYGLEWPDEFEGGTNWTAWDYGVKVYKRR